MLSKLTFLHSLVKIVYEISYVKVNILNAQKYVFSDHSSSIRVDVTLLSLDDGRQNLVETAKQISHSVTSKQYNHQDITPANVDAILQGKISENKMLIMIIHF